jgi:hypothetical protein
MWDINTRDKCINKYKPDHIYIHLHIYSTIVIIGLFKRLEGGWRGIENYGEWVISKCIAFVWENGITKHTEIYWIIGVGGQGKTE